MFITLEGPEGSGKSSQLPPLEKFLKESGYQIFITREPGGTFIGEQVREILSDLKNTSMQPRTEILLFQSSRAQLVEEVIIPHLEAGKIVLSDRYADSTIAYQGYGHQIDRDQLKTIVDFTTGGLAPDLTLLLDIDVEEGLRRKQKSGGDWNRLDDYDLTFHQRVRRGYLEMAAQEPQRWTIIDAGQKFDQIQESLRKEILQRLSQAGSP